MSPVAVSGLLATFVAALDVKNGAYLLSKFYLTNFGLAVILGTGHHVLYHLALAMYPRIMCTFADDEEQTPINTSVRVGQAVDVVGQAG